MQLFYNIICECQKKVVPLRSQRMPTGTLNYNIDIWVQSVAPQNKRCKPKLDFLKTRHFQESLMFQVRFMHARVFSVSFPCVYLKH